MANLLWLQGGACSGNTMSFLNAEERGPIEECLIDTPIANPSDPVEVGHVCRSFDSCLVCTVHAHDAKTGEELTRFRTA